MKVLVFELAKPEKIVQQKEALRLALFKGKWGKYFRSKL